MPPERISKVLAAAGVASRRGADELVTAGRVRVDGRPAVLGERVDPEAQAIEVDGVAIAAASGRPIYLALHKPAGVTSTVRDRHAMTTVVDLVPSELVRGARLTGSAGSTRTPRDSSCSPTMAIGPSMCSTLATAWSGSTPSR